MSLFLKKDEIIELTDRKMKGQQIEALRNMGLPFFVNATGHPVVARCAIEGRELPAPTQRKWTPKVLAI